MFKMCVESGSPNEGACLRYVMNRDRLTGGLFKICDGSAWPQEGGELKICHQLGSLNEGVFFRYVIRDRKGTGVFKILDQPGSSHEGAC